LAGWAALSCSKRKGLEKRAEHFSLEIEPLFAPVALESAYLQRVIAGRQDGSSCLWRGAYHFASISRKTITVDASYLLEATSKTLRPTRPHLAVGLEAIYYNLPLGLVFP